MRKFMIMIWVLVLGVCISRPAIAGGDWNDAGINWQSYEQGLAAAKTEKKPVCLIFYTDTCPHCANYSKIFHNADVVERSKKFVMIRINQNTYPDVGKKYNQDGTYIPRTFFLSSEGNLDPSIHGTIDRSRYYYDEDTPAPLLEAMREALQKLH
jgi:protein-disulfide reductase (glutathione)